MPTPDPIAVQKSTAPTVYYILFFSSNMLGELGVEQIGDIGSSACLGALLQTNLRPDLLRENTSFVTQVTADQTQMSEGSNGCRKIPRLMQYLLARA